MLEVTVKANLSAFNKSMALVKKTGASTVKGLVKGFANVGKSVLKLGTLVTGAAGLGGIVLMMGKAVSSAAAAEKAFANLTGLLRDPTAELMGYKTAIDDLSLTLGKGSVEITDAFYQSVSAGFRSIEDASSIVKSASEAAIAGSTDTATSVEAITRVLNAYSLSGKEAERVSDLLFQTVNYGVTTFGELAPQIGMVAGLAAKANVPMEEMFGTLATLTKTMNTPEAVTSLTAMISSFLKPTQEAAEAARQYGIEMSSATLASKGLVGSIQQLSSLGPDELAKLFPNIRALRGMISAASDGAATLTDTTGNMFDALGAKANAFQKQEDTLSRFWEKATNSIGLFLQKVGEAFMPEMKAILSWFNESATPAMMKWAGDLTKGMSEWRAAFAEATAGMSMREKLGVAWNDLVNWFEGYAVPKMKEVGEALGKALAKSFIYIVKAAIIEGGTMLGNYFWDMMKGQPTTDWMVNFLSWLGVEQGGWIRGYSGGGMASNALGRVQGQPGPDMVPAYLTAGEAVISAPVANHPANRDMVDALANAGAQGATYHDVSTTNINIHDRLTRETIRDQVIPAIRKEKARGYGFAW